MVWVNAAPGEKGRAGGGEGGGGADWTERQVPFLVGMVDKVRADFAAQAWREEEFQRDRLGPASVGTDRSPVTGTARDRATPAGQGGGDSEGDVQKRGFCCCSSCLFFLPVAVAARGLQRPYPEIHKGKSSAKKGV